MKSHRRRRTPTLPFYSPPGLHSHPGAVPTLCPASSVSRAIETPAASTCQSPNTALQNLGRSLVSRVLPTTEGKPVLSVTGPSARLGTFASEGPSRVRGASAYPRSFSCSQVCAPSVAWKLDSHFIKRVRPPGMCSSSWCSGPLKPTHLCTHFPQPPRFQDLP